MFLFALIACTKAPVPTVAPRTMELGPNLRAELITDGPIESRIAPNDDAHLIVYYVGEQQGSLAPCGCPDRPRGGLPRLASYLAAAKPGLMVNTGYWLDDGQGLDGSPREDATLKNQWMVKGLQAMSVDVVHVGFNDLFGLSTLPDGPPDLPLVSANLSGEGIAPYIVVEKDDQRIGITGISHPGHSTVATPGFLRADPLDAAQPIIEELHATTDVVLLLNHGASDAAKKLARTGLVDVVIETNAHRSFEPPFKVGDAFWVRSHTQGMRLGELHLGENTAGQSWAFDRKIDMDASLPDEDRLHAMDEQAKAELKALDRALFGR
jgi:2',3'-cyclic-nucleotide 2'-phosphodiesterase (5'-nucleotidase family)